MGRILRIGVDTLTNYTLTETTTYDANNPDTGGTPWSNLPAADQDFTQPSPLSVNTLGAGVVFLRAPDTFLGAMVKIEPTYDTSTGEAPSFEMWTHSSATNTWTLRRSIPLTNLFVGVPSGTRKVLDLTFFPFLRHVDFVWLTMNPGPTGTPTNSFLSIQLYGQCEGSLRNDAGGGAGDPCQLNPNDPLYNGYDDSDPPQPCPGTTFGPIPDPAPTLDVCNPESVAQYREYAATIPGFLVVLDAWLDQNASAISEYCAGINSDPPTPPTPPGSPPALPPLDLCDQDSIDAFRAALAGNAVGLANFEDFLDNQESSGFLDLVCPEPEPDEQYIDPETLMPAPEPDTDGDTPFGSGPGGQPQFPRPAQRRGPQRGEAEDNTLSFPFFFFYNAADQAAFVANLPNESDEIKEQYALALAQSGVEVYGTDTGSGTRQQTTISNIQFLFSSVPAGTYVGVRSLIAYPPRRTAPMTPVGSNLAEAQTYFSTMHNFSTYLEGPIIDENGYRKNGWGTLDPLLWIPDALPLSGSTVYKKTGEDILTLEPAASTSVNEIGPDAFGRTSHSFDVSDFLVFTSAINVQQDRFTRAWFWCNRTDVGINSSSFSQELPYAIYVHLELRPGFTAFNSTTATVSAIVNVDSSGVVDQAIAAATAANAFAGDPPAGEITNYFANVCPIR